MADAVIEFMSREPDKSLGAVVMNKAQADLLQSEIDYRIASSIKAQHYESRWAGQKNGLEKFFVKNLENVQGDERDVMFVGTVYGPESEGKVTRQYFGPINQAAGRRRLNVLFTRAKQRIETFSSMSATDIRPTNPGAEMLQGWLAYSASGVLESGAESEKEPDSEFEVHVIEELRRLGFDPKPQVGVAGYFVDIGVRHSSYGHGYLLGVECDGASYHSSPSARDRDRLRQSILEGLGWKIHRIWSTDWFMSPEKEIQKLKRVLDERLRELSEERVSNDPSQSQYKASRGNKKQGRECCLLHQGAGSADRNR